MSIENIQVKKRLFSYLLILIGKMFSFSSTAGFEPAIFWSVVRRVIRCATRPSWRLPSFPYRNCARIDAQSEQIWRSGHKGFLSVVVITCPSHGQGRRFDPGRNHATFWTFRSRITEHRSCVEKKSVCPVLTGPRLWILSNRWGGLALSRISRFSCILNKKIFTVQSA